MGIQPFSKIPVQDDELDQVQDRVADTVQDVLDKEILDGVLITEISLVTGSVNRVEHRLGRKPFGYIIVGRDANAVVWDQQASNTEPALLLDLLCSANVTVSLWVF